ncbi:hypothetical protein, partial [Acidiphilium multivorum]|uniref:hypothetical protein n=1 Tax=Acidiphilium multivorum TaxID=62140 RepID=UPI001F1FC1A2
QISKVRFFTGDYAIALSEPCRSGLLAALDYEFPAILRPGFWQAAKFAPMLNPRRTIRGLNCSALWGG